jgi:membrane protein
MGGVWATAVEIAKEIAREVNDEDLLGLAAGVAYNLLLALFPGLIFIAALAGFIGGAVGVDNLFNDIQDYLTRFMPTSAVETISEPLQAVLETQSGELLSLGIIGTLWAASNATATLMKTFNRIYDVRETRPFWLHRLLIAVGLTLLLPLLILAPFLLLIFGEQFGRALADLVGLGPAFVTGWNLLRLPISLLAAMAAMALLYWLGPNVRQSFRWTLPGLLLSTTLWLLFTALFGLYLANFGNYDQTYGTIAGVIVLLLWLNYSNFVVLLGVELNQALQCRYDPRMIASLACTPRLRARAADSQGGDTTAAAPAGSSGTSAPDNRGASPPAGTADAAPREPASTWLKATALGLWTLIILVGAVVRTGRARS